MTDPLHLALLFLAATVAGAVNSAAGGGTLLTFPALLAAGVSPVLANGTSTVALAPGSLSAFWGYRHEIRNDRQHLLWMGCVSVFGGVLGALLAGRVGDTLFSHLVPLLIFGATALFIVQDPIRRWLARRGVAAIGQAETKTPRFPPGPMFFQFFVALYGGFFGAGIGILMLAALGMMGMDNIHRMNGIKNFAAISINGVAAVTFALLGKVEWKLALLMAVGAIIGGYGGAGLARRVGQANVRRFVIVIGLTIGLSTARNELLKWLGH
ncbi:MAG: sulfite exporter TauE/SafE family protein [Armatimonadota bacterium]|nr:sulfite exporter TauE/SafE family protein [Armatimonadota bacterium]